MQWVLSVTVRDTAVAGDLSDKRIQDFISHKDRNGQKHEQNKKSGPVLKGFQHFDYQRGHETCSVKRSLIRKRQSTGSLFIHNPSISISLPVGISLQNSVLSFSVTFSP
ncbi:hypothetical protein GRO01_07660 [Gluconobacter roseus NBRC 3990]|uniref:Uncharacterized protein n=1 Tax=Gluconobacter roseus NBRC 3990 TaxID=1307950 RepID=A0A4Y3M1M5_9PROT|nr:hypothetical protein AA3990_1307 [Gluconobacter roseus NBRC 3990]GEB03190.1 hypothetical protein GRO01_07660 [Gluconobacter roseus NBRC 3990]GLP93648.1 hypothetical protein GCM10007871_16260 [Gluconobacter roseus NBRC 3990]